MLNIILWLVFGALAGWLASLIMHTDAQQGTLGNIVVGILGALIGGFVVQLLGGTGITGFNFWSLLVAILGAIILLAIVKAFNRGSSGTGNPV